MGYQLFDKKMMLQLGAQMGLRPDRIADASEDEHVAKSLLERMFASDVRGRRFQVQSDAREAMSVAQVQELINAAYDWGNMIIVGRGAQVVLAGKPDVLHVRVVAPVELRIRRWQARERLTADGARQKVQERDRAHSDFVKHFFGADIDDAALYDLVIRTAKIAPAAAADLIVKALAALPARAE